MNMKKWIYIFCAAGLLTACTDDVMDRLNRNENDPEDVPSRYLFTDAETSSAHSAASAKNVASRATNAASASAACG